MVHSGVGYISELLFVYILLLFTAPMISKCFVLYFCFLSNVIKEMKLYSYYMVAIVYHMIPIP